MELTFGIRERWRYCVTLGFGFSVTFCLVMLLISYLQIATHTGLDVITKPFIPYVMRIKGRLCFLSCTWAQPLLFCTFGT